MISVSSGKLARGWPSTLLLPGSVGGAGHVLLLSEAITITPGAVAIVLAGVAPSDPRLATTLDNLAGLYYAQGKYTDDLRLKRALMIRESVDDIGPPLGRGKSDPVSLDTGLTHHDGDQGGWIWARNPGRQRPRPRPRARRGGQIGGSTIGGSTHRAGAVNLWLPSRCGAGLYVCVGPWPQLPGYRLPEGSAGCLAGAVDTEDGSGGPSRAPGSPR